MVFNLTIKHWHAVAEWTWSEGDDDVCGICRNAHDGCAPDVKYPGDDSPVVWGACGHAFHLQCIQKWLASSTEHRCPMCRRPWQYKGAGEEDEEEEADELPSSRNESEERDQERRRRYEEGEEQDDEPDDDEDADPDQEDPQEDEPNDQGVIRHESSEETMAMEGPHDQHPRPTDAATSLYLGSPDEAPRGFDDGVYGGLFGFLRSGHPSHSRDAEAPHAMRWEGGDDGDGGPANPEGHDRSYDSPT